jgi:hypothetical protein
MSGSAKQEPSPRGTRASCGFCQSSPCALLPSAPQENLFLLDKDLHGSRLPGQVRNSFQRWGQPGQQQGRRIPSLSSVRTRSMCCLLVSGLLTEMTQQIHSLRASGVISSHFARASGSEMRTFRKSAGTACTAPRETALLVMDFSLYPTGVVLVRVVGNSSISGLGKDGP